MLQLPLILHHPQRQTFREMEGSFLSTFFQALWVYVGPRVGAHICLNLGVGLDRILHHTAKYLRVVARQPLAIYILTCNTACSYAPAHAFASVVFELCSYFFHC